MCRDALQALLKREAEQILDIEATVLEIEKNAYVCAYKRTRPALSSNLCATSLRKSAMGMPKMPSVFRLSDFSK